jgi:hypothetical protein
MEGIRGLKRSSAHQASGGTAARLRDGFVTTIASPILGESAERTAARAHLADRNPADV